MNSEMALSLWRERWGKAAGMTLKVPYVQGKINQWTRGLPYAAIWSLTGVSALTAVSCLLLIGLTMGISLSPNGQIVFSAFLVCIAVYVRRYAGMLITLVLVGLAIIASTRYLYWRFDATFVRDFSLNFAAGFSLFAAECYLALLVITDLAQSIWPLRRTRVALPSGQNEWPTIDVFILCYDQTYADIQLTSLAAHKLEWPTKKIKIYLIDGGRRDDLSKLAGSIGAHYLPFVTETGSHANFINLVLPHSLGAFIAVFESGQAPDKGVLQSTLGWFLSDQNLGMVQTPHHFLTPPLSKNDLDGFDLSNVSESYVLLRRSILIELGGVDIAPVTANLHMALTLQSEGYSTAYIGFDRQNNQSPPHKNSAVEPRIQFKPEIFLVEHAFFSHTLLLKQRIASLHRFLQFYYFAPRLLFLIAPIAYLVGGVEMMQASPELFASYAFPHFIHALIARARTHGSDRFTLVAGIRETILAWYMLLPITLTLLRTSLSRCLRLLSPRESNKIRTLRLKVLPDLLAILPYLLVLCLNLAGFLCGTLYVLFSNNSQTGLTTMYLLWSAYNLMTMATMIAVAKEAKQVLEHMHLRLHMPAMIKLQSGRTIACETENFPETTLGLSLPMPVIAELGLPVSISIFHNRRELVFPARVALREDLTIYVRIDDMAQHNYQVFATAVFSRGPDWPKWLPGPDADRPFPKWVTGAFTAVPIAVIDFVTNISKYLHWTRLGNRIQLWKKRND